MENEIKNTSAGIPDGLTPAQIVERLDGYIIGQQKAKRFVAVALRNRQRRIKLPADIRDEVAPKNILMIGPTGVGKTEIARRLAKLCGAPFLKVEATKYTEVGYVGRDVESMVRDLMAVGYNMVKAEMQETLKEKCAPKVEEQLLDLILPGSADKTSKNKDASKKNEVRVLGGLFGEDSPVQGGIIKIDVPKNTAVEEENSDVEPKESANPSFEDADAAERMSETREKFRKLLREGKLEDRMVEVNVHQQPRFMGMDVLGRGNPEDFEQVLHILQEMLLFLTFRRKTVTVAEARCILMAEKLYLMTDSDIVAY